MNEPRHTNADVRMKGFASRVTVKAATAWVEHAALSLLAAKKFEQCPLSQAAGRVLAREVVSGMDVPSFDRAMMDGYAIRWRDIEGAEPYNPLELRVLGEALPGRPFEGHVAAKEAVRIMTGAVMPAGADAVLPAEKTELREGVLRALEGTSPGRHIGWRGEDVRAGTVLFAAGRRLRPQDIGLLSSVGVSEVEVLSRPHVRIVTTGNELVASGTRPQPGKIIDSNGPMLAALIARDGGEPIESEIVRDEPAAILAAMREPADVVIVSGGSSVGQEDHAPVLLAAHGNLAIHGIAMRPSSPTGMGTLDGQIVFLLPGNPVSCLCAYDFFAGRAIRLLGGREADWPYRTTRATLARKISSMVGRVDYARVAWEEDRVAPVAVSGASVLSSTTIACGFVLVPPDSEGFAEGTEVTVHLYDSFST